MEFLVVKYFGFFLYKKKKEILTSRHFCLLAGLIQVVKAVLSGHLSHLPCHELASERAIQHHRVVDVNIGREPHVPHCTHPALGHRRTARLKLDTHRRIGIEVLFFLYKMVQ